MRRPPVEALTVATTQNRTPVTFSDREIDGSRSSRNEWDHRRLVAFPHNVQGAMTALESQILDTCSARLGDTKAVEPKQHGQGRMRGVESFRGEQKCAQLAAVQAPRGARRYLRTSHVLGGVGANASVDMREAVITADR